MLKLGGFFRAPGGSHNQESSRSRGGGETQKTGEDQVWKDRSLCRKILPEQERILPCWVEAFGDRGRTGEKKGMRKGLMRAEHFHSFSFCAFSSFLCYRLCLSLSLSLFCQNCSQHTTVKKRKRLRETLDRKTRNPTAAGIQQIFPPSLVLE
ncbi:hypothetical protein ACJRO7_005731 [Eucalyptus globulus]|uniref:Uncharacterized protein n=1 Tax=Eucalyptus globulus TaxID=34317 RepID=A0ABD3J3W1_EUCGL